MRIYPRRWILSWDYNTRGAFGGLPCLPAALSPTPLLEVACPAAIEVACPAATEVACPAATEGEGGRMAVIAPLDRRGQEPQVPG
ncbi:MAG: hypothetical protein SNJ83_09420 [Aggregatilineales bacterium]